MQIVLDYEFLRLPYEVVLRVFKDSNKELETALQELVRTDFTIEKKTDYISIQDQLLIIRDKVNQNNAKMETYLLNLKARILNGSCSHEQILQRSLVDFLLRTGHVSTAEKLMTSYQIENFTVQEAELISNVTLIIHDLKAKSISLALDWCRKFTDILNTKEFEQRLIFQHFITLLDKDQLEAYKYLQENSSKLQDYDIIQAMKCLALVNKRDRIEVLNSFSDAQWSHLIAQFKRELYNLFHLPVESALVMYLKSGISALRTPQCKELSASSCPLCNKVVQQLSTSVLPTQKLSSTWICRITGELMDQNNPPYILPNNQVYSLKALQSMSIKMNGNVMCPIDGKEFKFSDAVRIYL